ncbi:hypothetical protein GCM10010287_06880 [Streptomyces variabilis]|uniref:Uncharacterized protein n=1 Tax=Streptomyces variabilis TaxID=67372 RepID=A0ABQ2TRY4_9ACTN|nr:hypothetical protein GCM10010265_13750 [Streptomyces griseoincarnatus]GGT37135.1 hypothetical protein GCM10010287_06880 [Streptomyces variabilis]
MSRRGDPLGGHTLGGAGNCATGPHGHVAVPVRSPGTATTTLSRGAGNRATGPHRPAPAPARRRAEAVRGAARNERARRHPAPKEPSASALTGRSADVSPR